MGVTVALSLAATALVAALPAAGRATERGFPFDHELRFDADPVGDSERVPGLTISEQGAAEIDLWCVSGNAQAIIVENSITIVPISMRDNQCPPERLLMDRDLLTKLTQVTNWRWEGHLLVLVGPQNLRFRPASN
jgi:hypothetical protein